MRIADFAAFAKKRIGLVEKENDVAVLGGSKDGVEILFRFTDVFADNLREINLVEFQPGWFAGLPRVLPVPLGPVNSALTPLPVDSLAPKPHSPRTR